MARGLSRSLIGYDMAGEARWGAIPERADVLQKDGTLTETFSLGDADGATWRVERRYRSGGAEGSIDVDTVVSVDRDRDLLFFPGFVLLPGAGSFGSAKAQAVFCGLEYLGPDDASRSAAISSGSSAARSRESSENPP